MHDQNNGIRSIHDSRASRRAIGRWAPPPPSWCWASAPSRCCRRCAPCQAAEPHARPDRRRTTPRQCPHAAHAGERRAVQLRRSGGARQPRRRHRHRRENDRPADARSIRADLPEPFRDFFNQFGQGQHSQPAAQGDRRWAPASSSTRPATSSPTIMSIENAQEDHRQAARRARASPPS